MDTKKAISMFLIVSSMLVVALAETCVQICMPQCFRQNPWATINACQNACNSACSGMKNSIKPQDIRSTIEKINALAKGKLD